MSVLFILEVLFSISYLSNDDELFID